MKKCDKKSPACLVHTALLIFSVILLTPFSSLSFAADLLVLNTGSNEPYINENGGGFYGLLTREIFSRIGIDAQTVRLPSQRALLNANNGVEDGNIARIKGMGKNIQTLFEYLEK